MEIGTVDALILNYNDAATTKDCAERLQKYDIIRRPGIPISRCFHSIAGALR